MQQPLISVILCTYNGERFIEEQVDSILGQSYPNIELIISDDASSDATPGILKKYEADPRCRIFFQQQNLGLSENFAFAAKQSKGAFLAFADQDDIWLKDKIDSLHNAIGNSLLVYSDSLLVNEEGQSLDRKLSAIRRMYSGNDSRGYFLYSVVWGHGMLIRRELLERSLPIPAGVHHDVWLAFKALTFGGIVYLDKVTTHYRQHDSSTSKTIPQKQETRAKNKRYEDYQKQLNWLRLMKDHSTTDERSFYEQLFRLYELKANKKYVPQLASFMLKHRDVLFRFSRKNYVSQFIEIIKQARGESQ